MIVCVSRVLPGQIRIVRVLVTNSTQHGNELANKPQSQPEKACNPFVTRSPTTSSPVVHLTFRASTQANIVDVDNLRDMCDGAANKRLQLFSRSEFCKLNAKVAYR